MNQFDGLNIDQSSFAFLNLIGQTPRTINLTGKSITVAALTATSVVTPKIQQVAGTDALTITGANVSLSGTLTGATGAAGLWTVGRMELSDTYKTTVASAGQVDIGSSTQQFRDIWFVRNIFGGKIFPGTDAGAAQSATGIYAGTGAPNNANGSNGDYYFRSDGGAGTHIYFKAAGAWGGLV